MEIIIKGKDAKLKQLLKELKLRCKIDKLGLFVDEKKELSDKKKGVKKLK